MSTFQKCCDIWRQKGKQSQLDRLEDCFQDFFQEYPHIPKMIRADCELSEEACLDLMERLVSFQVQNFVEEEYFSWQEQWCCNGSHCKEQQQNLLYHVTHLDRLNKAIRHNSNRPLIKKRDLDDQKRLKRKLEGVLYPRRGSVIWTTWKDVQASCSLVTDPINQQKNYQEMAQYLQLSDKWIKKKDPVLILRYLLPTIYPLRAPTIADARWDDDKFLPSDRSTPCGYIQDNRSCYQAIHKKVNLPQLDSVDVVSI